MTASPWWQQTCRQPDAAAEAAALARQAQLTKPRGALGALEALAVRLAALQGREKPAIDKPHLTLFAGDHGVVAEGVSAYPQAVTAQMLGNFVAGGAAISVLAREQGVPLRLVDLGTIDTALELPGVRHLRLGAGTANFALQPAMTVAQCAAALQAGRDTLQQVLAEGIRLAPMRADFRLMQARLAMASGNKALALQTLSDQEPAVASNLDYYATRAALAQELEQPAIASRSYQQLVIAQPAEARWWLGLGISLDKQGRALAALDAYHKALNLPLSSASRQFVQQRIGQLE